MSESNNGESLSGTRPLAPKRHNAKRCRFATRQAIIYGLANDESVEFIRRKYHLSRHTVLAIREQYAEAIEAAQQRIKASIELRYCGLALDVMEKIVRQMQFERSPLKLFKIYDALAQRMQAFEEPVQTQSPQPLSIKFATMRRAKRNESYPVTGQCGTKRRRKKGFR